VKTKKAVFNSNTNNNPNNNKPKTKGGTPMKNRQLTSREIEGLLSYHDIQPTLTRKDFKSESEYQDYLEELALSKEEDDDEEY